MRVWPEVALGGHLGRPPPGALAKRARGVGGKRGRGWEREGLKGRTFQRAVGVGHTSGRFGF